LEVVHYGIPVPGKSKERLRSSEISKT